MKTIGLAFCCIILFFSCHNTKKISKKIANPNTVHLHEGEWVSNFKNEVFIRCLKEIYPSRLAEMFDSIDASSSANLDQMNYDNRALVLVDSLAIAFKSSHEASLSIEKRKITINVCMSYRNSKELDSIALSYYKRFSVKIE